MFHSRPARKVRAVRPRLEVLESRNLLSTWVVDRVTDTGAGAGLAGDLRYCLTQAADGDAVTFGVTGTIDLTRALPTLTRGVRIEGPGPGLLAVRGQWTFAIISVGVGPAVSVSGLALTEGRPGISNWGTLTVSNCAVSSNSENGILNGGTLTLDGSTVSDNFGGLSSTSGGGVFNYDRGYMTISDSTISDNVCAGSGDVPGTGGGIRNAGVMEVTDSTISGNLAGLGGGIFNGPVFPFSGDCELDVSNTTISDNTDGGIDSTFDADLSLRDTIIAGNHSTYGDDLYYFYYAFYSYGHNLIGHSSVTLGFAPTDLLGVDPRLGPLQDNGGPTPTMALLPGSPALNAGDPALLGTADQRGVARAGGVNIGSYQASATAFALTAPATVTAGAPFDLAVRAVDPFGQTAVGYTGTVHLSSSDGRAALPGDYAFTLADGGTHTFRGVALVTAGSQDVAATDTGAGSLSGSGTVAVRPAAADHLLLSAAAGASAGVPFDLVVTVQDAYGNTVTGYAGTVTFATDDPDGVVPADYTFTAADAGTHTFAGGVTLYADRSRVTATDTQMDSVNGSIIVPLG
jgi:hypothetical protein